MGGLGFKEMESFNLALLAKQWWRIIHNEKSLSFRVLKDKYFPNSEPMRCPKGPNSSYLWNSLWEGRRIVEQGATWRVGDGRRIDVWVDPWLKKGPDGRVTHPYGVVPTNLKVCCLIDMERREWKMESVKEIFTEEDAKLISSIHLSKVNMPDRLIWRDSESGELSVKTGYIVARKVLGKDTTPDTSWKEVWCVIWKAVVAPKVKLFAWRLIQGFIPVWSILISRGIQVHNCCCMCASCGETVWHVFF